MKKFLAVYMGSETGANAMKWNSLDEKAKNEREAQGGNAWMKWATENGKALSDFGGPLGDTLQVNPKGISSITNQMCAYTIVEAENHEAAAKLFLNHPHFSIFPGDSVEIMEILPVPKF